MILLFPGTCCYWKTNFGHVLENLQEHFYVGIVSYSGFDETEHTTFLSELDEVEKVEKYIKEKFGGKIFAAYGCSLGGSFGSLLVSRKNIHIDHAIIGSSDMDQAKPVLHRPVHKSRGKDPDTGNYDPCLLREKNGGKISGALSQIFCGSGYLRIRPAARGTASGCRPLDQRSVPRLPDPLSR